jgi:hypothetical protein
MKEKTSKTVRLCYGSALGAMTVILGALFIWQVLTIYLTGISPDYTGEHIFSRERVLESLSIISPAFWIWVAMIVVGFVLWEIFPVARKRTPYKDDCYALARLKKRISKTPCELSSSLEIIKREERIVLYTKLFASLFILAISIYCIVYLSIPSNFPKIDVGREMLTMIKKLLPFIALAFLLCCGVVIYEGVSAKKQLPHAKKLSAYKGNDGGEVKIEENPANKFINLINKIKAKISTFTDGKYFKLAVRIAIGCLGVAFIIAGIANGNMHGVLVKAINICTECIGLG